MIRAVIIEMRATAEEISLSFESYLRTADEAESEFLLERLLQEYAAPIIKQILRYKLHRHSPDGGGGSPLADEEDISEDALVRLLNRLRHLKKNPGGGSITDFRAYVVSTTYNAFNEYLRQKHLRRWRLKDKLRYLLRHHRDFALWDGEAGGWVCGFAAWRGRKRSAGPRQQGHPPHEAHVQSVPAELNGLDVPHGDLADLVAAIFERVGEPLEFDQLVNVVSEHWGTGGATPAPHADALVHAPAPGLGLTINTELELRQHLRRLWIEVCQLPLRQRKALLLNLRDAQGRDIITLIPATGMASLRQIAEALEMPLERFTKLWGELPLEDATIAELLGATRPQVIALRRAARERLGRRLNLGERKKRTAAS